MDDTMAILLFRHGLTEENAKGKYIGWSDPALSNEGIEQLSMLKDHLPPYDVICTSDLTRCRQTAEILFPAAIHIQLPSLREIHFGEWENKTYSELQNNKEYRQWLSDMEIPIPGGESFQQFRSRISNAWEEILSYAASTKVNRMAVITHGGVIRQLLTTLVPKTLQKNFWEWKVPHGLGYELVWTDSDKMGGVTQCSLFREAPLMEKKNG